MQLRRKMLALCLAGIAVEPLAIQACGYDNPESIALGSLNWAYPNALYVRTAVSEAESSGLLPSSDPGARTGIFAFHRAIAAMKAFGAKLSAPSLQDTGTAISVVLVPQVLWTRFTFGPAGATMQSHAEGPDEHDLVIVTEEKVVRALLDGRLDAIAAEERGLLRYYGEPADTSRLRDVLAQAMPAK